MKIQTHWKLKNKLERKICALMVYSINGQGEQAACRAMARQRHIVSPAIMMLSVGTPLDCRWHYGDKYRGLRTGSGGAEAVYHPTRLSTAVTSFFPSPPSLFTSTSSVILFPLAFNGCKAC